MLSGTAGIVRTSKTDRLHCAKTQQTDTAGVMHYYLSRGFADRVIAEGAPMGPSYRSGRTICLKCGDFQTIANMCAH